MCSRPRFLGGEIFCEKWRHFSRHEKKKKVKKEKKEKKKVNSESIYFSRQEFIKFHCFKGCQGSSLVEQCLTLTAPIPTQRRGLEMGPEGKPFLQASWFSLAAPLSQSSTSPHTLKLCSATFSFPLLFFFARQIRHPCQD